MSSLISSLPIIFPIVFAWAEKQESLILDQGQSLDARQMTDARQAGVVHPDKIRVLRVEALPQPDNEDLMFLARQIGFFTRPSAGMALGYGIYLQQTLENDRHALVHECVHVGQYEKKGGIRPFLSDYLRECIAPGYPFGRLEQEAIIIARDICKQAARE